jgi:hypothetical protein
VAARSGGRLTQSYVKPPRWLFQSTDSLRLLFAQASDNLAAQSATSLRFHSKGKATSVLIR